MNEIQSRAASGNRHVLGRAAGRVLIAIMVAAALGGCVVGPTYHRPDIPLPRTWRVPAGTADDVVNTAWWKRFQDPDLDALIKQAIDANMDLLQATARVKQYEAKLDVASGARYPEATYNIGAERRHYSTAHPTALGILNEPTQNDFGVGLGINWELDIWGKLKRADQAALADLLSSQYARHAVMLTVVTNVATSYFQLLALDDQLRLARQTLRNRGAALNLIENRYKGGSSSKMAVLQARSAVDEVWVAIPDLERQIAVLEDAMSILVGRNPGKIIRHRDDEPALPPVPSGVPSDVLSRRPDVLAAEQQLIGANARIGVAKAALFPSISLTGMLGVASNALDTLTDGDATEASIGLGLLGPIFAGGRLKAGIREAEAYQQELLVKYRQTVLTALGNVDDALTFNVKANEIARRGEQQVATLNDRLHLSEVRYNGGQADYLEVLTAERDLYNAQAQQVDRHRDTYLAMVSIYGAMGGGWMVEQDKLRPADKQDTASAAQPAATTTNPGGKGAPAAAAPAAAMPASAPPTKVKSPESAQ